MPDRYLTAAEVAALFKVTVDTVYDLVRKEQLPAAKLGGQWRFDSSQLDDWFRSRTGSSSTEAGGRSK